MKIKDYRSIGGRDFYATMECEHCPSTQELRSGYDDAHYHNRVIPAMTCKSCGKNRAGDVPEVSNDNGRVPVPAVTP